MWIYRRHFRNIGRYLVENYWGCIPFACFNLCLIKKIYGKIEYKKIIPFCKNDIYIDKKDINI